MGYSIEKKHLRIGLDVRDWVGGAESGSSKCGAVGALWHLAGPSLGLGHPRGARCVILGNRWHLGLRAGWASVRLRVRVGWSEAQLASRGHQLTRRVTRISFSAPLATFPWLYENSYTSSMSISWLSGQLTSWKPL